MVSHQVPSDLQAYIVYGRRVPRMGPPQPNWPGGPSQNWNDSEKKKKQWKHDDIYSEWNHCDLHLLNNRCRAVQSQPPDLPFMRIVHFHRVPPRNRRRSCNHRRSVRLLPCYFVSEAAQSWSPKCQGEVTCVENRLEVMQASLSQDFLWRSHMMNLFRLCDGAKERRH